MYSREVAVGVGEILLEEDTEEGEPDTPTTEYQDKQLLTEET